MIKAWIKNIIREYVIEERNAQQGQFSGGGVMVSGGGPPVVDAPAIVTHSIRNGFILAVHTSHNNHQIGASRWGDYVFCKDNDELASAIIAEFTKNKLGIPSHVQLSGGSTSIASAAIKQAVQASANQQTP